MNSIKIISTGDGSHSLLNTALHETYHSVHGAMQESAHVFIKNGLAYWLDKKPDSTIKILEVGFGTGLNALLTLQHAKNSGFTARYHTLETDPLDESIWSKLNYSASLGMEDEFIQLHRVAWDKEQEITPNFILTKIKSSLQRSELPVSAFDLIYFDAFAPSKQPEMWHLGNLEKIAAAMTPGGVFVTYCAKGQVKRDLTAAGLRVETLPGPPGKKEMVRAIKNS
jgi:tRNA U34 5-methylaminomethyl-2-thiouridine-forming methyltransferase MnmC